MNQETGDTPQGWRPFFVWGSGGDAPSGSGADGLDPQSEGLRDWEAQGCGSVI